MISYIKALVVAIKVHKGQKDKAGRPYIFHPLNVSFGVRGLENKVVALLHDVLEDGCIDMESLGFLTEEQREALKLLTREKDVPYLEYIEKIKNNRIAKNVKLSDLRHNSDLKRLKTVSEEDRKRIEKYNKARKILSG